MNFNMFIGTGIGILFGAGCFYALTNWRLKVCEDAIKLINEKHLAKVVEDVLKIRLTLAKITQKLDIEDDPISEEK